MTDKPTLVMKQAPDEVHEWMHKCKGDIDGSFGKGYAAEHPELLGAMIQACAVEQLAMHTRGVGIEIGSSLEEIGSSLEETGSSLESISNHVFRMRSDVAEVADNLEWVGKKVVTAIDNHARTVEYNG